MGRIILLASLLCTSIFVRGQQTEIDSLINLSNISKKDTLKLYYLSKITSFYSGSNVELSEIYCDSLLSFSIELKNHKYETSSYLKRGIIKFRKGSYKEAVQEWKIAKNKSEIYKEQNLLAQSLNNLALGYKALQEHDSVLKYMLKAKEINLVNNNEKNLAGNYYSLADFYFDKRDFDNAVKNLNALQEIAIQSNDSLALSRSYILLAKISRTEYDYKDSEILFDKALNIFKKNVYKDNPIVLAALSLESANSVILDHRYEDALMKIEAIENEFGDVYKDNSFWTILEGKKLSCYLGLRNFAGGGEIYQNLLKLSKDNPDLISHNSVGYFNLSRYEIDTKNVDKKTLERLQNILEVNENALLLKSTVYKNISEYYKLIDDKENELINLNRFVQLKDSVNTDKFKVINLSLKRKFNEELQQKENQELRAENAEQELLTQRANTLKWIFGIGLFAIALTSFFIWRKYKAEEKAKNTISQQKDEIENQKHLVEKLQKELHHRLKNDFRTINSFIRLAKAKFPDQAYQERLNELQNRITSMFSVHTQLHKQDDVTQIIAKPYLEGLADNIKHTYGRNGITLQCKVDDDEILLSDKAIPIGIILNEFVTNSYKHAFENDQGVINISLSSDSNNYHLLLKDDGKGLSKDFDIDNLTTFGMEIIKLLTIQYKGTFELQGTNGVIINISLPKQVA